MLTRKAGVGKRRFRCVACGNFIPQAEGEAGNLYASGVEGVTLRVAIAFATQQSWSGVSADIKTAFLNAPLECGFESGTEEVIIVRPPSILVEMGLMEERDRWRVVKALYGLRQAPRAWAVHRDKILTTFKFSSGDKFYVLRQSISDESFWYVLEDNCADCTWRAIMLVYVDDILALGPVDLLSALIRDIQQVWTLSEPTWISRGKAVKFCGLELEALDNGFRISQSDYLQELFSRYNITCSASSPLLKWSDPADEQPLNPEKVREAQGITGALLWASTKSRPDVAFAVSKMGQYAVRAPNAVIQVGYQVLRFLYGTVDVGIEYRLSGGSEWCDAPVPRTLSTLELFTDASHAPEGGRSCQAIFLVWCGMLIAWEASKQPFVTLSSAESELVSVVAGIVAAESVGAIIEELIADDVVISALCDNQAAVRAFSSGSLGWRNRHLRMRAAAGRERIQAGSLVVTFIPGEKQVADLATKPLARARIFQLLELLAVRSKGCSGELENPARVVSRLAIGCLDGPQACPSVLAAALLLAALPRVGGVSVRNCGGCGVALGSLPWVVAQPEAEIESFWSFACWAWGCIVLVVLLVWGRWFVGLRGLAGSEGSTEKLWLDRKRGCELGSLQGVLGQNSILDSSDELMTSNSLGMPAEAQGVQGDLASKFGRTSGNSVPSSNVQVGGSTSSGSVPSSNVQVGGSTSSGSVPSSNVQVGGSTSSGSVPSSNVQVGGSTSSLSVPSSNVQVGGSTSSGSVPSSNVQVGGSTFNSGTQELKHDICVETPDRSEDYEESDGTIELAVFPLTGQVCVMHYLAHLLVKQGERILGYLSELTVEWTCLRASCAHIRAGVVCAVVEELRRGRLAAWFSGPQWFEAVESYLRQGRIDMRAADADQAGDRAGSEVQEPEDVDDDFESSVSSHFDDPGIDAVPHGVEPVGDPPLRVPAWAQFFDIGDFGLESSEEEESISTTEPSVFSEVFSSESAVSSEVRACEPHGDGLAQSSEAVEGTLTYVAAEEEIWVLYVDDLQVIPLPGWSLGALQEVVVGLNQGDWSGFYGLMSQGPGEESSLGFGVGCWNVRAVCKANWWSVLIAVLICWVFLGCIVIAEALDEDLGTCSLGSEQQALQIRSTIEDVVTPRSESEGDLQGSCWWEVFKILLTVGTWEILRAFRRKCRRSAVRTAESQTRELVEVPLPLPDGIKHRARILYCLWRAGYSVEAEGYPEEVRDEFLWLVGNRLRERARDSGSSSSG